MYTEVWTSFLRLPGGTGAQKLDDQSLKTSTIFSGREGRCQARRSRPSVPKCSFPDPTCGSWGCPWAGCPRPVRPQPLPCMGSSKGWTLLGVPEGSTWGGKSMLQEETVSFKHFQVTAYRAFRRLIQFISFGSLSRRQDMTIHTIQLYFYILARNR